MSKSQTSERWPEVKHWVWKYLGNLIMDSKNGGQALSMGRLSFWAVLGLALYMWSPLGGSGDIPATMGTTLMTLMGYNLGTKGLAAAKDIWQKPKA